MTSKSTSKIALCAFVIGFSLSASTSAFAQYNPNIHNNAGNGMMDNATPYNPAPYNPVAATGTGYTNDGTLMMGGQKIGNPHQILHDLNVPSFFGVDANRLTFTDNPSYGSGTLAQMENHTLTIGVPAGNVVLSRLYLTPTNPYTEGVATPHNNYQTYQSVVADAQAGSYQLTVANDNKLYAFKTLGTMSTQSQNILIKELPAHSVFVANSDPKGGAVAVRVTQSGDYAAMQNYFDTVKPYDFSWRSAFGVYANDPNSASFVANWVMGSHQVQAYQANLQNQSMQSGNEAFGVLAWDANQNKYVMLDPTNTKATSGSVSGNMPTLGNNQFGFFGMHTHSGSSTPSEQDLKMTQKLGLDQMVIGTNGTAAIFTDKAGNDWQGMGFEFETSYVASRPLTGTPVKALVHGYIVTGASYPGDPKARVNSWGPSNPSLATNRLLIQKGDGTDVNNTDIKFWINKDARLVRIVDQNGNDVPDEKVQAYADNLSDYLAKNPTEYNILRNNSNTAALSVAVDSSGNIISIPGVSIGVTTLLPPRETEVNTTTDELGNIRNTPVVTTPPKETTDTGTITTDEMGNSISNSY